MLTLVGHGYVGSAIAAELYSREIAFRWFHHGRFHVNGPVINAAGYTGYPNVDACEARKRETVRGNIAWPVELEALAGYYPVVHIGSGCIYEGDTTGGWKETDEPNFTGSFYSSTKVLGQLALQDYLHKSYLLRIRMPFGLTEHPKNLITKLAGYSRLVNGLNSLSRIEDVARVAVNFAIDLPQPGIYNVVNPGAIQTKEIAQIMGWKKPWFEEQEFRNSVKAQRSFCVLNSDKLQALYPMDEVRVALNECIPDTPAVQAAA